MKEYRGNRENGNRNVSEREIKVQNFSSRKMHLKFAHKVLPICFRRHYEIMLDMDGALHLLGPNHNKHGDIDALHQCILK